MYIILAALFYFSGIFFVSSFNIYAGLFFGVLLYFCWTKRAALQKKHFVWFFLFLLLGLVRTVWHQDALQSRLLAAQNWRPERLVLRIVSDVQYKENTAIFTARAEKYKIQVRLRDARDLQYGEKLTLDNYRLFPLRPKRNFFITGYDDYLYARGYSLRLNADAKAVQERKPRRSLFGLAIACKDKLAQVQQKTLPPAQANIMSRLLFGSASSALDKETLADYRRAGIIHLLVISGMHIAIFLALLQSLLSLFRWRGWPAFWLITLINILFVFSVGAGASVLRAGLMAEIALFGRTLGRRTDACNTLALSGLILCLVDPLLIYDIGFQLSVAATFSLIYFVPILNEYLKFLPKFLRELLAVSIAPLLLTMPLSIYYFQGVSLGALFLNILVLPWAGLQVSLGFIASLTGLIFLPAALLINSLNYVLLLFLQWLVGIFAQTYVDLPQTPLILLFISLGWSFILVWRPKALGKYTVLLLIFILGWQLYPGPRNWRIIFLDIGQGDCIVLTQRKRAIVIDCGSESGSTAGETLSLTLRKLGLNTPDVLLTHAHADHYNGLLDLPRINALVLPESVSPELAEKLRAKAKFVTAELPPLKIYSPPYSRTNENNNSLLVLLEQNNFRVLFTGDAETKTEKYFLDQLPEIDVLKAGHHGSKTSSSTEFLAVLQPDNSIVSVGAGNKYRLPAQAALDRLAVWSNIWRTDEHGAILITAYPRYYKLTTARTSQKEKFPVRTKY